MLLEDDFREAQYRIWCRADERGDFSVGLRRELAACQERLGAVQREEWTLMPQSSGLGSMGQSEGQVWAEGWDLSLSMAR